jgi:hypothetical protein
MLTGKSFAKGNTIQTRMGLFKTRPGSLDFQYINYAYELDIKRFIEKEEVLSKKARLFLPILSLTII